MFESRFRSRDKRKRAPARCSAPSVYANRANKNVVQRLVDNKYTQLTDTRALKKARQTLRDERQKLKSRRNDLVQQPEADFHEITSIERELAANETNTRNIDQRTTVFEKCLSGLNKFGNVQSLIVSQNLVKNDDHTSEIYTVDADRCVQCNSVYAFDVTTNYNVCSDYCKLVNPVLFVTEDRAVDVLILRATSSGPDDNKTESVPTAAVALKQRRKSGPDRSVGYRKFLDQFSENAPTIPTEIMSCIYKYLATIHILSSIRCRSYTHREYPPIPWLRFLGQLRALKYADNSTANPIPTLSSQLIDNLVARYVLFSQLSDGNEQIDKKKTFGFELITSLLLRYEDQDDVARQFALHKTRDVLRVASSRFRAIVLEIQKRHPDSKINWDRYCRSC